GQADITTLEHWNQWLSASRETEELRHQSWQMGRSLLRLLGDLEPAAIAALTPSLRQDSCNFAVAFGIAAAHWQLPVFETTLIYLQSWAANLISAGVRLVPLGQTEGQRLMGHLIPGLEAATQAIVTLPDRELTACSWGLTLASMAHETQYSRLFRS
ncbi:MAG: urease accessory UreF family protein, partial [Leptolyngbya sp.]|nr:urease accessory UreF family protein [Leptolyngbya sp.]